MQENQPLENRPAYTMGWAAKSFGLAIAIWIALSAVLYLTPAVSWTGGYDTTVIISSLITAVLFAAFPVIALRAKGLNIKRMLMIKKAPSFSEAASWAFLGMGLAYAAPIVSYIWYVLLEGFGIMPYSNGLAPAASWTALAVQLAVVAVLPAFCEELFFRGFLMRTLEGGYGRKRAVVFSGLLFTLIHANLLGAPAIFMLGCSAGIVDYLTGSIYAGMAVHFSYNAVSVLMAYFSTSATFHLGWYVTAAAAAIAVGGSMVMGKRSEKAERVREIADVVKGKTWPYYAIGAYCVINLIFLQVYAG